MRIRRTWTSWPCVECGAPVVLPEGTRTLPLCDKHRPSLPHENLLRGQPKVELCGQDYGYDERPAREAALRDARAFIARRKAEEEIPTFTPANLMRELRIGRNLAASLLEELEAAGDLIQAGVGQFVHAGEPQPVGGYALPLSQKEASALLRLLDWTFVRGGKNIFEVLKPGDPTTLREVRRRLKGGPL